MRKRLTKMMPLLWHLTANINYFFQQLWFLHVVLRYYTTRTEQMKSDFFFSCIQQISFMHSTWWNKRWKYCLCIQTACGPRYVSVEPESGCASSSSSSTKLRPLTQPTSQTCACTHTDIEMQFCCVGEDGPFWVWEAKWVTEKEAVFKRTWRKYKLRTTLRLPKNHSKASHSPHQPWKNLTFSKRKQKWQGRGKRGGREGALSRDVIHTATYIFLLFPTTDGRKEEGFLSLEHTYWGISC